MKTTNEVAIGLLGQLKEPDNRPPSEWAVGQVTLPHSKVSKEWAEDTAPWLIEPLNATQVCEFVSVCKPTQTGGTTIYEVFLAWLIANAPEDSALMAQTDPDGEYLFRSKLLPTLRQSPATASLLAAADRHAITKNRMDLGTMSLKVHGPGKNSTQSASLGVLLLDECWLFPRGTILEILERTGTREGHRRILAVSQAGEELLDKKGQPCWDEWGEHWHKGTQEIFHVACPHCPGIFEPLTSHFKTAKDTRDAASKAWNWTRVNETTYLETPCCKQRIENTPTNRRKLAKSGRYIATNPNVARNPDGTPKHRSFRYSAWVVYWLDWGNLLEMFLRAQDALKQGNTEPLKIWTQKKEARFWTQKDQEIPSFQERKFFGYKLDDYKDGSAWEQQARRIMSVDMQTDCFKVLIRDFAYGGASRLIYQRTVKSWAEVAQVQTRFRVLPQCVCVDGKNWPQEVFRECATRGWFVLQGSDGRSWRHTVGKETIDRPFSPVRKGRIAIHTPAKEVGGRPSQKPGHAWYYEWSNLYFKDWLSRLIAGLGLPFAYGDDAEAEYIEALDSEARKTNERGKPIWLPIGKRRNHYWDCECMALVFLSVLDAAIMDGVGPKGWDLILSEPIVVEPEPDAR